MCLQGIMWVEMWHDSAAERIWERMGRKARNGVDIDQLYLMLLRRTHSKTIPREPLSRTAERRVMANLNSH